MSVLSIDGRALKKMIAAGAARLEKHKALVDSLNVFPVPDGDTGTNMSMTTNTATKDVLSVESDSVSEIAKAAAGGALKGARGNSGVILSQLFRGFAKSLEGKTTANADDLADAMQRASETAYKAVMKPKEGTILTVARVMAERAFEAALDSEDITEVLIEVLKAGYKILSDTTEMLPQLKQANVVDSGGKGLLFIFEGACEALGVAIETEEGEPILADIVPEIIPGDFSAIGMVDISDITFIYDTEFFIITDGVTQADENAFRDFLEKKGDSIVLAGGDGFIKVHVHSDHPGEILERALMLGNLQNLKIENMLQQHEDIVNGNHAEKPETETETITDENSDCGEPKDAGFIAVSAGAGFAELFKHLEVDQIIEGGQTMNPSTEDFINAAAKINAQNIIMLPNNKNVIWAAQQAADMCPGKNITVLETQSVPQGIAAMINYMPDTDFESCVGQMKQAARSVKTGNVTYAVRDSNYGGREIKQGDIICVLDDEIVFVSNDVKRAAEGLIDIMAGGESELLSIYYGAEASETAAVELKNYAAEKYPDCETEAHSGGQPLYFYTISAE